MTITTEGDLTVLMPENKAYLSDGETYSQTDDVEDVIAGAQEITAEEKTKFEAEWETENEVM